MKISFNTQNFYRPNTNQNQNKTKQNATSFTSYRDTGLNKHCTNFVRPDIKWDDYISFLRMKFQNVNKVNSIILGGSDGSEAYTYVMLLLKHLGKEALKFLPVKSVEMSPQQHSIAKSGNIPLMEDPKLFALELSKIFSHLGDRKGEYFDIKDKHMIISPQVKQFIDFRNTDLTFELPQIPPKNSVVMMRNTWNYLDDFQKYKVTQFLQKMDKSSVFVTGNFDYQWDNSMKRMLQDLKFEYTTVDHVFEKVR